MQKIKSEVTGTVWRVEVQVGQEVATDDVLVIVESMKMEIPIVAGRAGKVSEILVGEGDPVADDQVVVHFYKCNGIFKSREPTVNIVRP
jgi:biotin carboxyl carrier protein